MLLKLDLQMFADGEEDLDITSMLEEFETEWTDEETDETEGEESAEDDQEVDQEAEETNPNDEDAEKRNRAFADLRRQADENRKYADFINRLAQEGGVSPDDLLARYEERQMESEAEQKGIPVEYLQKQTATESRLAQLESNMRAERIEAQIETAKEKYGADDDAIRETFKYMMESGIDPRVQDSVDFDRFYRAANLDAIIQKEVTNTRQKDLEDKRKRQEGASIGNGTSVSPSSGELSDEEFDAELERLGIRL